MSTSPSDAAADAAAVALTALPQITPARLLRVLTHWPDPLEALTAVRSGRAAAALGQHERDPGALARRWAAALDAAVDAASVAPVLARRGTRVLRAGTPSYPIDEGIDDRPAVLLAEGERPDVLERPRVAVVGTRAATPHGLADARELGAVLARAGVAVVSGLAIGIDAAAHQGALDAGGAVIGVIATGLDVVYPRRHVTLHDRVRRTGLLITEQPFGTRPHATRFPVRNRIIAALADVTVVVEATATGGAHITASAALRYGRDVLAVPGSRRNPSAAGCNALLGEGAGPLVVWEQVLEVLGLTAGSRRHPSRGHDRLVDATFEERACHRALAGEPATADELAGRTGLTPGGVAVAVAGLVRAGRATRAHGLVWPM